MSTVFSQPEIALWNLYHLAMRYPLVEEGLLLKKNKRFSSGYQGLSYYDAP
jgi:hypothetical protein